MSRALPPLPSLQELAGLSVLSALNLSFNPLPAVPPVVFKLSALMELNLDHTGEETS